MSSSAIILSTLNSTYQHSSFGLRYLLSNMQELSAETLIIESTIKENPRNLVEKILSLNPKIVGFGVYIWNSVETLETVMILKKVSPETVIVLGGPEVSYETENQAILRWCDYVVKGEADFIFPELCRQILSSQKHFENSRQLDLSDEVVFKPQEITFTSIKGTRAQIVSGPLPDIKAIRLPYRLYTDEDIKNRVIYVEASRGCPYKCEYCLSSLDKSVRSFNLELFLSEIQILLDRGARTFKFVDRTFNLSPTTSVQILEFFLSRIELSLFLHFELVPDRLPIEIRELISKFPAGSLQFEIGIQTLNPEVASNVSRKNDLVKVEQNFKFLRENTKVHTHADLIVGLPGESLQSFAQGFDRLVSFGPDEIQVGILKRLKGTPIARHEVPFKMQYSEVPPFQILSTSTMTYAELQLMNRFAKFWDLYSNSGEFKNFIVWLKASTPVENADNSFNVSGSVFSKFLMLTEFLSRKFSDTHSISLVSLAEQAYSFMIESGLSSEIASEIIQKDYCFGSKRRDLPTFLKGPELSSNPKKLKSQLNERQLKHLS